MPEEFTSELLSVRASGDAAAIIESTSELVATSTAPDTFDGIDNLVRVVIPEGWRSETLDLEDYAGFPRRKKGTVTLHQTASLAAYVNDQKEAGTTLYADPVSLRVEAVINDHSSFAIGLPGHRDHRATLILQKTPGCIRWLAAHGKYLDQEAFAQLIEDGLTEIAVPSGADLLELAQTMHATTSANFRSAIRLDSGQVQFQYVEEIDAKAGRSGDTKIPATISLVFEPFFGAEPIQVEARLRYRLSAGKLALGVWLIRHEEALRQAFEVEVDTLAEATDLVALYGQP